MMNQIHIVHFLKKKKFTSSKEDIRRPMSYKGAFNKPSFTKWMNKANMADGQMLKASH